MAEMTGSEITSRRKALSLTQQELANDLHITSRTLIRWEMGELIPENMKLLLKLYFESKESGETMSPAHQQIIYVSKADLAKKGMSEVIIRLV